MGVGLNNLEVRIEDSMPPSELPEHLKRRYVSLRGGDTSPITHLQMLNYLGQLIPTDNTGHICNSPDTRAVLDYLRGLKQRTLYL